MTKRTLFKLLNVAFALFIVWLIGAINIANENKEYGDIVNAIENSHFKDSCSLEINVTKEWPFGWSPSSMELTITKGDVQVSTGTSKFFKPDRIGRSPGEYYYYFSWTREDRNEIVPSFLELELNSDQSLNWIKVGMCEATTAEQFFSASYQGCRNMDNIAIECS